MFTDIFLRFFPEQGKMIKKHVLGLSARLLFFIIPVISGSLIISGSITGLYADRGVKKVMVRLIEYKAEDLIRHSSSQWNLLLENNLQNDPAYMESFENSIRSYSLTMLQEEGEWILAVDEDNSIVFSVGSSASDDSILESAGENAPGETGDIWIDGNFGGESRLGYGFFLPALGWTVYITELRQTFYADLYFIRWNYIIMVLLTAIISSFFIYYYIHRSLSPLKTVISDMQNIVQNRNFGKRVIPVQNDEVGELAREFNLMSDYLDRAMTRLKNIARSEIEMRIEIRNRERETLDVLSKVSDHKDPETARHTSRVGMYASLLSELRGDSTEESDLMRWSVPLHDIGKVGIPDAILLKNGALNKTERLTMEKHVIIGNEVLKDSASPILRAGADIAISHHERWDGSGYPGGLKGRDIPVRGRITGIVDVFDALTTARPYKEAWSLKRAVEYIRERSGTEFDPELVELLFANLERVEAILIEYGDE